MKLSFGKPKAKAAATPILKQPVAFASLDDDEPLDAAPTATASGGRRSGLNANKQLASLQLQQSQSGTPTLSRAQQKQLAAAQQLDASVYEYDSVYDRMQAARQQQQRQQQRESEAARREPRYVGAFMQAAQTRKLDRLRAEEKMLQREREAEGDAFAGKDAFVTQAYKDQMAEVRRAEEEEKKREALEKSKKGFSTGMAHFYKQLLEESDAQHSAAVSASQTSSSDPPDASKQRKQQIGPAAGPNLTITRPEAPAPDDAAATGPLSDLERARLARAEGKDVELNDDNEIVDQRDLLSAGLNLAAPNTRRLGLGGGASASSSKGKEGEGEGARHRAVGTAASRREIAARREREVEEQLQEEQARIAEEARRREEERVARIVQKRNTEEDVRGARERYLERKRRKLDEAAVVPEAAEAGG